MSSYAQFCNSSLPLFFLVVKHSNNCRASPAGPVRSCDKSQDGHPGRCGPLVKKTPCGNGLRLSGVVISRPYVPKSKRVYARKYGVSRKRLYARSCVVSKKRVYGKKYGVNMKIVH